jgi:YidC/Oxa1 family membrane protein insertase
LHSFIANWGLVIIVFSTIIKLITMPLSRGQMKSMRKMQTIMPQLTEVKEKYKDDPKTMQAETFKLYREYGVNPAGGCLPLLLQMPILFALYSVLVNVIELRQAPFVSWITDLSVPDVLFNFGSTNIPLLGNHLSGLTLLMGATMIIQTATQATDPRQKKMAYIMPILFTFLFNNLPSGVALYYFMFNLFGIGQQLYNKKFLPPLTLESLREGAKKKKGFMARMQEMEKTARSARQATMAGKQLPGPKKSKKK